MKVIDAVKNTAFTTAINSGLKYLEKDPEVNIPKLMSLVDKLPRKAGMKVPEI